MNNAEYKILLIEFSGSKKKILLQMLMDLGFNVNTVNTIESAIQKVLSFSPDLVICVDDLGEYTGFQIYNMLEREIFKKGTPFILVLEEFSQTNISMGQELGIDAFLFPPYEHETIGNILENKIRKSQASQALSLKYLKRLYELIPIGIFIAENRKIVEANSHLFKLLDYEDSKQIQHTIDELFDFTSNPADKIKLTRFLNGITKSCSFNGLRWKHNVNSKLKLTMHYLDNGMPDMRIFGSVISLSEDVQVEIKSIEQKNKDEHNGKQPKFEIKFLTRREQEILNLSAEGLPIKIIADQLGISERTVEKHRSNILHKTSTGNIIEAMAFARKRNFLNDPN